MWIVFDIGNSAIKCGLFRGEHLQKTFTLPHDADAMRTTFDHAMNGIMDVERAGLTSVVPEGTDRVMEVLRARGLSCLVLDATSTLPFRMAYRTPETLGTDRIAAAAEAWAAYGGGGRRNVVAMDAGSALTYEVIERDGVYRGGTIVPGPALMQRALHTETAQLPEVPLDLPDSPIGGSTVEAMQAGIMYGFIDGARGLLGRIGRALDGETHVVATGGWSRLLHDHVEEIDAVDAHLVLRGIRRLMTLNG